MLQVRVALLVETFPQLPFSACQSCTGFGLDSGLIRLFGAVDGRVTISALCPCAVLRGRQTLCGGNMETSRMVSFQRRASEVRVAGKQYVDRLKYGVAYPLKVMNIDLQPAAHAEQMVQIHSSTSSCKSEHVSPSMEVSHWEGLSSRA